MAALTIIARVIVNPGSESKLLEAWTSAAVISRKEPGCISYELLHAKDSTIVSQWAGKKIVREPVPIAKEEPLKLELQHFVECIRANRTPVVSGESAKQALDLAFEITSQIAAIAPAELPV